MNNNYKEIIAEINTLKKKKNAVILGHYYMRPEIQDFVDYIGDSLGLSQEAGNTTADIIVFCGVHFMAETASIISPHKKVLIPDDTAGCSLAESICARDIIEWRKKNPEGIVVSYVNTTAETKAHSDYCCTSANALKIVSSLPDDKPILFTPDKNLGAYIKLKTGKKMEVWNGNCCVHEKFTSEIILEKSREYPEADILIHPESNCSHEPEILNMPQTYMYSTSGMIEHVARTDKNQFIIVTETGTIHQMKKNNPDKLYIPIQENAICEEMKKINVENVLRCLKEEMPVVKVEEPLRSKAWLPIKRMLEFK